MKKNDQIELQITDMGVNGEGIGHQEGCAFFVKDALPGDRVLAVITKMKKGYGYAKMQQVLMPSEHRVTPPCPSASRCGGCQIMQLDYREQLRIKEEKVRNNLQRIGGFAEVPLRPIIGMDQNAGSACGGTVFAGFEHEEGQPLHFRNKMQFPVSRAKDGRTVTGFYAGRTHYLVETEDCPVAMPETTAILRTIREFADEHGLLVYDETTGAGLLRHVLLRSGYATGQILVCLVINGTCLADGQRPLKKAPSFSAKAGGQNGKCLFPGSERLEEQLVKALLGTDLGTADARIVSICLNVNQEQTNVILGQQVIPLYGEPFLTDKIDDLEFRISPLAFFQVNGMQTPRLYGKAMEYAALTGKETVWDLYCGTGTISLFLARKAGKVFGIEIVPQAIEDAKENAKRNGISNAEFFCGKSEELFPKLCGGSADVVVLDPPRKGCDPSLLDAILQVLPERIVYVSCDSATLARDLQILSSAYKLVEATPVDMFPHTMHVECVVSLSRK